jgi:hypothetical protein
MERPIPRRSIALELVPANLAVHLDDCFTYEVFEFGICVLAGTVKRGERGVARREERPVIVCVLI